MNLVDSLVLLTSNFICIDIYYLPEKYTLLNILLLLLLLSLVLTVVVLLLANRAGVSVTLEFVPNVDFVE